MSEITEEELEEIESLFVQTAIGLTSSGTTITLRGVGPWTLYFADRPQRVTGHMLLSHFVDLWGEGENSFEVDPPNAVASFFDPSGTFPGYGRRALQAADPGQRPQLFVEVLEGELPAEAGPVALFIDPFGRPLSPVSLAGMNRRARRRGRWPDGTSVRDDHRDRRPAGHGSEERLFAHPRPGAEGRHEGHGEYERGTLWIENQDPASRKGATIGWVRRYQAADGQLYAVLLAAYLFLTLLPAFLVESSYMFSDPSAFSTRVEHRLGLTGVTATLFHGVLVGSGEHKLSSVLIALVDLFFFGLGFGRVLQLVHARSWGLDLRKSVIADQSRYLAVLGALIVMTMLFLLQTRELRGDAAWIGYVLDIGWLAVVTGFFIWAPYELLHHRVSARDILPGAIFTVVGLIVMRIISSLLLTHWLNWYSKTYGALGIVMAIFFWMIILTTIMVLAAALSPALAHPRNLSRVSSTGRCLTRPETMSPKQRERMTEAGRILRDVPRPNIVERSMSKFLRNPPSVRSAAWVIVVATSVVVVASGLLMRLLTTRSTRTSSWACGGRSRP